MNCDPELNGTPKPGCNLFGEELVRRGMISRQQLDEALAAQRQPGPSRPLGELMIERGWITPEEASRVLAETLRVPYVRLTPDLVSPEAVLLLPKEFLERHNALPLSVSGDALIVALEKFSDVRLHDEIARRVGRELVVVAAAPDNLRAVRSAVYAAPREGLSLEADAQLRPLEELLEQIGADEIQVVEAPREDSADLEAEASESPAVMLLNYVIKTAIERDASDIHVEPEEGAFRIRYRVDGDLTVAVCPPIKLLPALVSRIKILSGMDISERRMPQDGSMTVTLRGHAVDIRVSTMATRFGEKVVMRILRRDATARTLEAIGMEEDMLASFRSLIAEPNGLILVTGPTGSGKSTTLYAALAEILSDRRNISTLEDPVERIIAGINQFQVASQAGLTFARALRALLRQDPDVIMVGEIRDPETARLAAEAALTGHLVLSTLHTNDAPTAVPRLINMGVEPYLVSATLRGVIAQRLIRRVCPHCAAPAPLAPWQLEALERFVDEESRLASAMVGKGCVSCGNSGCRGRIGIFELVMFDEGSVMDADQSRRAAPHRRGVGLLTDGLRKVRAGLVSVEALLAAVLRTEEPRLNEADDHRKVA